MTERLDPPELRELFARVVADEPPLGFTAEQVVRRGSGRLAGQRVATGGIGLAVVAALGLAGTVGGAGPTGEDAPSVSTSHATPESCVIWSPTPLPAGSGAVVVVPDPCRPGASARVPQPGESAPHAWCLAPSPTQVVPGEPEVRMYAVVPCPSDLATPSAPR